MSWLCNYLHLHRPSVRRPGPLPPTPMADCCARHGHGTNRSDSRRPPLDCKTDTCTHPIVEPHIGGAPGGGGGLNPGPPGGGGGLNPGGAGCVKVAFDGCPCDAVGGMLDGGGGLLDGGGGFHPLSMPGGGGGGGFDRGGGGPPPGGGGFTRLLPSSGGGGGTPRPLAERLSPANGLGLSRPTRSRASKSIMPSWSICREGGEGQKAG